MINDEVEDRVVKLPKWVQDYIRLLQRERDDAIWHYQSQLDDQTASPFFHDTIECCTGKSEIKRRYVQASHIQCEMSGIVVDVRPYERDGYISVMFSRTDNAIGGVAIIP